jgi:cytochrome P450
MITTFDPTTDTFAAQRTAVYRQLREEHPVFYDAERDTWVLSRYAEVYGAANDSVMFSSVASEADVLLPMLNYLDAPRHTQLRRMVARAFTPARVASLEEPTRKLVDQLLDAYLKAGGGDLIAGFSGPLASTVVGRMIGIPEDRLVGFRHLTDELLLSGQKGGTEQLASVAARIYAEFEEVVAERRQRPGNDLVSALLEVQRDGDLSDAELFGFCFLLVGGGNDTTSNLVANGWVQLLRHPDAMAELDADRSLLPSAIEEMLRVEPPAESHMRTTTQDVALLGTVIPAGARVQLLWGAANLDEREFPDPERFDIHRMAGRHLTFGHGVHFCLGATLGRLEARLAFDRLLDRAQHLRLAEEPERLPSPWACAYSAVLLTAEGPA